MDRFSISQLSQFSGVKPHTIRVWEQRYNALQPDRSEGNTRYYDGHQLRRLLNIVSLMNSGYKISRLCLMKNADLYELLGEHYDKATQNSDYDYFVGQLIAGGMSFNQYNFEKIFSHCLLRFGLVTTYKNIIYPLLKRVGLLWTRNQLPPAQEHYISNLLRQKLFTAIDSMPPEEFAEETWLLFLPEDEFHEIGLLFAHYLVRSKGYKSIYLGASVPLDSVKIAIQDTEATNIFLFLVHHDLPKNIQKYLITLEKTAPDSKIFVAAPEDIRLKLKPVSGIHWLSSVDDLEQHLDIQQKTKSA